MQFKKVLALSVFAVSAHSFAATKGYQVSGPVVSLTDKSVVVLKGKEKWELNRTTASKIPADVAVGDKVTVYYEMTATEVEKKAAPVKK